VSIENRFNKPTALGWRDVTVLAKVPLRQKGGFHISEIQFCLAELWGAREALHKHVETIRTVLPKVCHVLPQDMFAVQQCLLDHLSSMPAMPRQVESGFPSPPAGRGKTSEDAKEALVQQIFARAKQNSAAAVAWVSPRWRHCDCPRLFAEPAPGDRRRGPQPELQVSIARRQVADMSGAVR